MKVGWERIEEVFLSALQKEPAVRRAHLDAECGDEALRREVESLLASHERAGSFMQARPSPSSRTPPRAL